jgi:hypothetical protein
MVIDCTLDSFMVPGFSGYNPAFGTKKPDDQPVTSREANSNIMMPFSRQRPYTVTEDSVTTTIAAHSAFEMKTAGVTLTLGAGGFAGCEVKAVNTAADEVAVTYTDGGAQTLYLKSGEEARFSWSGAAWKRVKSGGEASKADMINGLGRNLLDILHVSDIAGGMAEIRRRCNNNGEIDASGIPDFTGIEIGDYIDGLDLSAIIAENGGTAGQAWSGTYKNNRIMVAGFNTYKGVGDTECTKNHILFVFANVPLRYRMNPSNDNAGGYHASDMRAFLDGTNGDGTGSKAGVTTGAFYNALKAQLGNYLLKIRRLFSNKTDWAWQSYSLWLPSENEVFGANAWGEAGYGDGQKLHLPLYQKSYAYRIKRYNGSRDWWWLCTPYAGSAAYFCNSLTNGIASYNSASAVGGCAPAFCVA